MADAYSFNREGAERVVKAVRKTEAFPDDITKRRLEAQYRRPQMLPTLAIAQEVVAEGATGTFKFATGAPGDESAYEDSVEVEVTNTTCTRIWQGSLCVICWLMVEDSEGSGWHVLSTNSATHVTALVNESGGVAENDSTYDVDTVVAQHGFFPLTELSGVQNTHQWEMDDNAAVQLIWNETEGVWKSQQVTCSASDPDEEE